jgi:AraC-like DNA-binding protein
MTGAARLLDCFPLVRTQSIEELYAGLEQVYAKPKLDLAARTTMVDAALNYLPLSYVRFGNTRYGIGAKLTYPESNVVMQTFPLHGRGAVTGGAFECALDSANGMITTPGMTFAAELDGNYETVILMIEPQALADKLATITGKEIGGSLRFQPIQAYARPQAKALRDHVLSVVAMLSLSAALPPKLLLTEFEDSVAATFLAANAHNYSHLLKAAVANSAPWQVRQAEEFIAANWQRPITLEALVAVTGTSALSLCRSFKKSRGCLPLEFARRVRLCHAHELLHDPHEATSVAAIAALCGFADPAAFDRDYVQAFGERPAETLRRNRGDSPLQ